MSATESKKTQTEAKKEPTYSESLIQGFRDAPTDKKSEYLVGLEDKVGDAKQLSAEQNSFTCEFLAAVYAQGVTDFKIDPSEEKMKKFLNEGAKSGSTSCMISLGDAVSAEEPGRAKSLLEAALNAKDFRAANSLGVLAMRSNDIREALTKFELAESHGVPNAANNLCITRMQKCQQLLSETATLLRSAMQQFANQRPAAPAPKPAPAPTAPVAPKETSEKKE